MIRFIILLLLVPVLSFAQDSIDPEAKIILDQISDKLKTNDQLTLDFDLTINFPGMDADKKKGRLIQKGSKFRVEVGPQIILSTGADLYMINMETQSAQLSAASSMEASQGMMNPKQMLTLYDNGDYFYAITGEEDYNGSRVLNIEFKPKDRYAEFSKMRMAVNKNTNDPVYLKLFNKDGSQFILDINTIDFRGSIDEDKFVFSERLFPNIQVEDLRID